MKIKLAHRSNRALTFLGAVIVFACIILMGALLIKLLLKMMERVPPPPPPPPTTNRDTNVVSVTSAEFYSVPANIVMPAFRLDASQLDPALVAQRGSILIERSTNLVDWEPAWRMGLTEEFNFARDTNGIVERCFYRAVLIQ